MSTYAYPYVCEDCGYAALRPEPHDCVILPPVSYEALSQNNRHTHANLNFCIELRQKYEAAIDKFFETTGEDYPHLCWDSFCGGGSHTRLCIATANLYLFREDHNTGSEPK